MSGRDARSRTRRIVSILTLALLLILPAEDAFSWAVSELVSNAVRDARSKLSGTACSQIFSDFRDSRGRTLQENLDALGRTGESYLEWVNFYDGLGKPQCGNRGTLAATSPGSRVVYICSPQFREKQYLEPGLAAVLIIHEELHSLGLTENPPSSRAITNQVIARCGR